MKKPLTVLASLLVVTMSSASGDPAVPGNSSEVFDCDYIVTTVSRGDFLDCETNHFYEDICFDWAHERKALLEATVGQQCEEGVRLSKAPGGCEDQGTKTRIVYHVHRGLECGAEQGCTGRDGNSPPHDHWEFVHFHVDCN